MRGPRSVFLLALAAVDILYAIGLALVDDQTRGASVYVFPATLLPLQAWSALWFVVALVLIGGALVRRLDGVAFVTAQAIKIWWGLLMVGGWVSGDVPRGYVWAGIWLGFAVAVAVCARHLPMEREKS